MSARPTWKGHLKVSLVTIPIRVFPATDSASAISFNQLHGACQTRIQQKRWCPSCDEEIGRDELVKGYEFEKGRYVVVDPEDLAKVRPESTRVINLMRFTDAAAIDPAHLDRPYYLAPDGKVAAEAFAVMREGMEGKAGIGKVALHGREYLVAVQPRGRGLIMYTLRHANEVRSMDAITELDALPGEVNPDEVALARQVIGTIEGELNLTDYQDQYKAELRKVIDAKVAGEEVIVAPDEAPPKVVNLMDALRKSLDSVDTDRKRSSRAAARTRTTTRKRARG